MPVRAGPGPHPVGGGAVPAPAPVSHIRRRERCGVAFVSWSANFPSVAASRVRAGAPPRVALGALRRLGGRPTPSAILVRLGAVGPGGPPPVDPFGARCASGVRSHWPSCFSASFGRALLLFGGLRVGSGVWRLPLAPRLLPVSMGAPWCNRPRLPRDPPAGATVPWLSGPAVGRLTSVTVSASAPSRTAVLALLASFCGTLRLAVRAWDCLRLLFVYCDVPCRPAVWIALARGVWSGTRLSPAPVPREVAGGLDCVCA